MKAENLQLIQNVPVTLKVIMGSCQLSVAELFALKQNSVIALDKLTTEPVEVYLADKVIARGQLVVAEDNFAVKITEVLT